MYIMFFNDLFGIYKKAPCALRSAFVKQRSGFFFASLKKMISHVTSEYPFFKGFHNAQYNE